MFVTVPLFAAAMGPLCHAAHHVQHACRSMSVVRPAVSRSSARMDPSAFGMKHRVTTFDMDQLVSTAGHEDFTDRRAKIVATLGPASFDQAMIEKLIMAGVNIFRLNSSHRQGGQFEALVPMIREASARLGKPVELLGDLQGPKFRCATVENEPMVMPAGSEVRLALMAGDGDVCKDGRVVLARTKEQEAMITGLEQGMTVKIDDGAMRLRVTERVSPDELRCAVEVGGGLKSRKGINVPDLQIACSALTAKDIEVRGASPGGGAHAFTCEGTATHRTPASS